jgi:hypothetical protein
VSRKGQRWKTGNDDESSCTITHEEEDDRGATQPLQIATRSLMGVRTKGRFEIRRR